MLIMKLLTSGMKFFKINQLCKMKIYESWDIFLLFSRHVGARDMTMSLFHNFKLKRAKVDSRPSIDIENGPEPFTELISEHQEDQSDG